MGYISKKNESLKNAKSDFNSAVEYLREQDDVPSFWFRLVGSAKRNLILEHHNKGFDLDYQILFYEEVKQHDLKPLKDIVRGHLDDFFTAKGYDYGEDSRSAITIKKKGLVKDSKIINSYDVVLFCPHDNSMHVFRYETDQKEKMTHQKPRNSDRFQFNYNRLNGPKEWQKLREIYESKKIENTSDEKKSYSLLIEATKETLEAFGKQYK